MNIFGDLRALAIRIAPLLDNITTEEAAKNALVLPFINILGYNIFDPTELIPEFTADVGTKKGEKVDYAIMRNGIPAILIECKKPKTALDLDKASQLYRYFAVTDSRIGLLTDGILYRFFSDLEQPNKMDFKPFFEFNLLDFDEGDADELTRFGKSQFDLEETLEAAIDLKYTQEIKRVLLKELNEPTDEFVKYITSQVYTGRLTQQIRSQFTGISQRAFREFVNDRINARLKSALEKESKVAERQSSSAEDTPKDSGIVTTEEEIEAYHIIRAILRNVVDVSRIVARDTKSYCGILLDDNNRKPICRLHFNRTQKYLGVFNTDRMEERIPIEKLDDIFKYDFRLKEAVELYEKSV